MEKRLFLCVDGGGTKTEAVLADTDGRALGRGIAGGSNALSVGKNQALGAVKEAIDAALGATNLTHIHAIYLFIPGFSACLPLPYPVKTHLLSDSVNAYFGALAQPGGIALLAGTGSFAVSFNEKGEETSIGGWGPFLGDEGSGFDIGRRAVIHTLALHDIGMPLTPLGRAVLAHYNAADKAGLIRAIYHGNCDRGKLAALCPVVGKMAEEGDEDAFSILCQAADALALLAARLKSRLHLDHAPAALLGGVSMIGEALKRPLRDTLLLNGITLQEPLYDPITGGILYAYQQMTGMIPSQSMARAYYEGRLTLKKENERI